MKTLLRPFILPKSKTQVGYLCTANHVLFWLRECSQCHAPICTMAKAIRESRAQGQNPAQTWVAMTDAGVRTDSGKRVGWARWICVECLKEVKRVQV